MADVLGKSVIGGQQCSEKTVSPVERLEGGRIFALGPVAPSQDKFMSGNIYLPLPP